MSGRRRMNMPAMLRLMELADYVIPFALRAMAEHRVADHLAAGPRTSAELAAATGLHRDTLERLLRALTCKDVFAEPEPGVFALSPLAEPLRSDHPHSLRESALLEPAEVQAWADVIHSLRTGSAAFDHVHGRSYHDCGGPAPHADRVQAPHALLAHTLLPAYAWEQISHLVDVGCGVGAFTAALLTANPAMTATLLDRPDVIDAAAETVRRAGVADRAAMVAGDFFDEVPKGADAYLLKAVLKEWDDDVAARILASVRAAMRPDSRLLVLEALPDPDDDRRLGRMLDVEQLVLRGSPARDYDALCTLLRTAGLRPVHLVRTPTLTVIEARGKDWA
ncbi:methyltransferase [Nonomuraea muscovyensis]|uniref:methyltransferase n=1 Tax=Nonomuraea muscovyensis TaxID=1124761 RepID=UPI0034037D8C